MLRAYARKRAFELVLRSQGQGQGQGQGGAGSIAITFFEGDLIIRDCPADR